MAQSCVYCGDEAAYRITPGGDLMRETPSQLVPVCGEHAEVIL